MPTIKSRKLPKHAFKSFADFKRHFYPESIQDEHLDPGNMGSELAWELLARIKAVLTKR